MNLYDLSGGSAGRNASRDIASSSHHRYSNLQKIPFQSSTDIIDSISSIFCESCDIRGEHSTLSWSEYDEHLLSIRCFNSDHPLLCHSNERMSYG